MPAFLLDGRMSATDGRQAASGRVEWEHATHTDRLTLLVEHDMDVVFSQADRIIVLDRGQLIAGGTPAEVRANANVRAVYLGSAH